MIGFGFILAVLCSCNRSSNQFASSTAEFTEKAHLVLTNDLAKEVAMAGKALKRMHDESLLPGDSKNEHGQVTFDNVMLMESNKLIKPTYPFYLTFHLVKVGETTTNNYRLVKLMEDSSWKLYKAWETDSNGQVIKEWPVQ